MDDPRSGQFLHRPGEPINSVHFFQGAVGSLLTVMADGASSEVGSIGREGMSGLPVVLGHTRWQGQLVVLVPGRALRIRADALREEMRRSTALQVVLLSYAQSFLDHVGLVSSCNTLHPLRQRLCSRLLLLQDRVGASRFALTQEYLAAALGVQRASVSEAAGELQRLGAIRYARGRITILDRRVLEAHGCECHQVATSDYERLLGAGHRHPPQARASVTGFEPAMFAAGQKSPTLNRQITAPS